MAARSAKRRITVWGVLVILLAAVLLSGCGSEDGTEPNEPNAATAEANA